MEPQLVVVATFINKFDADIAVTALRAAGIDTLVRADDCEGLRPGLWMGGVALLVRGEDAARAREILETEAKPSEAGSES